MESKIPNTVVMDYTFNGNQVYIEIFVSYNPLDYDNDNMWMMWGRVRSNLDTVIGYYHG